MSIMASIKIYQNIDSYELSNLEKIEKFSSSNFGASQRMVKGVTRIPYKQGFSTGRKVVLIFEQN